MHLMNDYVIERTLRHRRPDPPFVVDIRPVRPRRVPRPPKEMQ
jgi:hypothetical protein